MLFARVFMAVLVSGGLLTNSAGGGVQDKEKSKEELKKEPAKKLQPLFPKGFDPELRKEIEKQLEEARKSIEELQKRFPGDFRGAPMFPPEFPFAITNRLGAGLTKPNEV